MNVIIVFYLYHILNVILMYDDSKNKKIPDPILCNIYFYLKGRFESRKKKRVTS